MRRRRSFLTADPWAEVYVDGQLVETTPFATPLRLRAGVRYLTARSVLFVRCVSAST